MEKMNDEGFYTRDILSEQEYRADPAMSWSQLKRWEKSSANGLLAPSFGGSVYADRGIYAHLLIQGLPTDQFYILPESTPLNMDGTPSKRSQEYKEAPQDKILLSAQDDKNIRDLVECALTNAHVQALVEDTSPEVAMLWGRNSLREKPEWFACKGLMDLHREGIIIDIKTTSEDLSSISKIQRWIYNSGIDGQAAWYTQGVYELTGDYPDFYIIALEMTPPYKHVRVIRLTEDFISSGITKINKCLDNYFNWMETGVVAGYPEVIIDIDAPRWAA